MSRYGNSGVDDSLLFFFLILVLLFCMPGLIGFGCEEENVCAPTNRCC